MQDARIFRNDAFQHKDKAQRLRWTFYEAVMIRMDLQINKGRVIPGPAFHVSYLKQYLKLLVSYLRLRHCFFLRSKTKKTNKKERRERMVTIKAL